VNEERNSQGSWLASASYIYEKVYTQFGSMNLHVLEILLDFGVFMR